MDDYPDHCDFSISDITNDYGLTIRGIEDPDIFRVYNNDDTILLISKDWEFSIGDVHLFTVNRETSKITFSVEYLEALREQLKEEETK